MWKNLSKLTVVCLLATGCKNASVDKKDDPSVESGDGKAGAAPRSGKIDLGARRNRGDVATAGSDAVKEDRREALDDRRRERIAQFDGDGDGKISDDERKAARYKRAEDMRKQADADGNGKVTPDELAKGNFRRLDPETLDVNKDGDVSIEELETALEQRTRAWGGGRLRGDGRFGPRFKDGSGGRLGGGSAEGPSKQP